jgi:hypothetical protein
MPLEIFPRMPRLTCPFCSAQIQLPLQGPRTSRRLATDREFSCPTCECELLVRFRNVGTLSAFVFGAAVLVGYVAGLRGIAPLALAVLALRFGYFLVLELSMRLFPPDVELCCDFRRILYSREVINSSAAGEPPVG